MIGPFSNSYVRDWALYHGAGVIIGIIVSFFWLPVGLGLITVSLSVGLINYLVDRTFDRRN